MPSRRQSSLAIRRLARATLRAARTVDRAPALLRARIRPRAARTVTARCAARDVLCTHGDRIPTDGSRRRTSRARRASRDSVLRARRRFLLDRADDRDAQTRDRLRRGRDERGERSPRVHGAASTSSPSSTRTAISPGPYRCDRAADVRRPSRSPEPRCRASTAAEAPLDMRATSHSTASPHAGCARIATSPRTSSRSGSMRTLIRDHGANGRITRRAADNDLIDAPRSPRAPP